LSLGSIGTHSCAAWFGLQLRGAAARHELEVRDDAGLLPAPLARVPLEEGRGLVGGHQVREDAEADQRRRPSKSIGASVDWAAAAAIVKRPPSKSKTFPSQCTDQNSDSDSVDLKVNIFVELQHVC